MNIKMSKSKMKLEETRKGIYVRPAMLVLDMESEELILTGSNQSIQDVGGEDWESHVTVKSFNNRIDV
jgi:hypothetical protein